MEDNAARKYGKLHPAPPRYPHIVWHPVVASHYCPEPRLFYTSNICRHFAKATCDQAREGFIGRKNFLQSLWTPVIEFILTGYYMYPQNRPVPVQSDDGTIAKPYLQSHDAEKESSMKR